MTLVTVQGPQRASTLLLHSHVFCFGIHITFLQGSPRQWSFFSPLYPCSSLEPSLARPMLQTELENKELLDSFIIRLLRPDDTELLTCMC